MKRAKTKKSTTAGKKTQAKKEGLDCVMVSAKSIKLLNQATQHLQKANLYFQKAWDEGVTSQKRR